MANKFIKAAKNLAKNEVRHMTISDKAFKAGKLPELTRQGIKNWKHLRPLKAFTPKMLMTGPTPASGLVSSLMIGAAIGGLMEENLPVTDHVSGRAAGRAAFQPQLSPEEEIHLKLTNKYKPIRRKNNVS